jgi:hypothetical protein
MYTIHVVEEDPGKDSKITITAKIGTKLNIGKETVTLGAEAAFSKEFYFSKPDDCGSRDLNYYDPADITLYFEGLNSKDNCHITFSE